MIEGYKINRPLDGIWVDLKFLKLEDINKTQVLILAIIEVLERNSKGCFAGNSYFAKLLNITNKQVSANISDLKEKGYLFVEYTQPGNNGRLLKCKRLMEGSLD
ncbi:helix-turn-helix domain-containing protein [Robertkochia marina]|nr:helix-turn-helix domain-containing protein [Robertkochia marina]